MWCVLGQHATTKRQMKLPKSRHGKENFLKSSVQSRASGPLWASLLSQIAWRWILKSMPIDHCHHHQQMPSLHCTIFVRPPSPRHNHRVPSRANLFYRGKTIAFIQLLIFVTCWVKTRRFSKILICHIILYYYCAKTSKKSITHRSRTQLQLQITSLLLVQLVFA